MLTLYGLTFSAGSLTTLVIDRKSRMSFYCLCDRALRSCYQITQSAYAQTANRSQIVARATKCTEWKSAFVNLYCNFLVDLKKSVLASILQQQIDFEDEQI